MPVPRVSLRGRLATNLRRLRASRRWTQDDVAEHCKLSDARTVQHLESGAANATLDTLERLCAGFGVEPAVLLAPAPPPERRPRGRPPILRKPSR